MKIRKIPLVLVGEVYHTMAMIGGCCNDPFTKTGTPVIGSSQAYVLGNRICNLHLQCDEPLPTQLKEQLVDCIQLRAVVEQRQTSHTAEFVVQPCRG